MSNATTSALHQDAWDKPQAPQGPPATILLVEDETTVRLVTREALELGGYKVLEANGPAAATRIAHDETTPIDLLLTDVVMPGMSGPQLAQLLQAERPELVTLYMTGYADIDGLHFLTQGASASHIQKPFTVTGLLARVADALAARWNASRATQALQHPSP